MDSIRFRNYKCFDDTGDVSIKPLTFLLGANSSGKSSFLEFFPLLKQSIGVRRTGLFLWYSNEVDFQDFPNTVRNGKGSIEISLSYNHFVDNRGKLARHLKELQLDSDLTRENIGLSASMTVAIRKDNYDYLENLKIAFLDNEIEVSVDKNYKASVTINNRTFSAPKWGIKMSSYTNDLIPRLLFDSQREDRIVYSLFPRFIEEQDFMDGLIGNEQKEAIFFREILFLKQKEYDFYFKRMLNREDIDYDLLRDIYLLVNLNDVIELLNARLSYEGSNLSYIKPLRVTTERYYRYQNYAVDEIDSIYI